MDKQTDKLQEESKKDSLVRGEAFNRMVREDGWKFVKKYFEARLQAFATQMLVEDRPTQDFDAERHELIGIRKLFGFIDNDIKILDDEKNRTAPSDK